MGYGGVEGLQGSEVAWDLATEGKIDLLLHTLVFHFGGNSLGLMKGEGYR